jgi:hypothetical protein
MPSPPALSRYNAGTFHMAMAPGARLGPSEVVDPLGAGGPPPLARSKTRATASLAESLKARTP